MNYFKESILTTLEIGLALYIIIFGYAVWDNFKTEDMHIAEINDRTREIQIYSENNVLTLHNVAKRSNLGELFIKIGSVDLQGIEKINLILEDEEYDLKNEELKSDGEYYILKIKDIDLNKYETRYLNYRLEIDQEYLVDYDFYIKTI